MKLQLTRNQIGAGLDHLGEHAAPEPDHGDGGEVTEGQSGGSDQCASPIAPKVPPRQAPPDPAIVHYLSLVMQLPIPRHAASPTASGANS